MEGVAEAGVLLVVEVPGEGDDDEGGAARDSRCRYFTLEYSALRSEPHTVLAEWTAQGSHMNLGGGPPPSVEAFASELAKLLLSTETLPLADPNKPSRSELFDVSLWPLPRPPRHRILIMQMFDALVPIALGGQGSGADQQQSRPRVALQHLRHRRDGQVVALALDQVTDRDQQRAAVEAQLAPRLGLRTRREALQVHAVAHHVQPGRVVVLPWDKHIAAGSDIQFDLLSKTYQRRITELAAALSDDFDRLERR
mgnify:CR=1 FL=1